ncbi:DUF4019 domain-containing protein [Candidatus Omnitrophota bacterium]
MRFSAIVGLAVTLFAITACAVENEDTLQAKRQAAESAEAWLALVDAQDYEKSWEEASGYFKSAVPKDEWQRGMQAARKPLGEIISRKLKKQQYATTLPGAPDGQYVVILYETSLVNKKAAIETITPMLDKDGQWRVSGYYIK